MRTHGYIPDPSHVRAAKRPAKHLLGAAFRLPHSASLIEHTPAIRDQLSTSSCVGFAKWRCIDTRLAKLGVPFAPHSPLGIYGLARILMRESPEEPIFDEGSMPYQAVRGMREWGVPTEATWPFDEDRVNDVPPLDVLMEAATFRIDEDYALDADEEGRVIEVKHAISMGYPVFFGTQVDQAFVDYDGEGLVAPCGETPVGGHALTLLAYEGDVFTGANSWGEGWGWHGFFKCGIDFLVDARAMDFSMCAITLKTREDKE